MTPVGIHLKRTKGWRMPEHSKSVARPHRYGNPFPLEPFGREDSVRMFRDLILNREAWWESSPGDRHRFTHWHSGYTVPTVEELRADLAGWNLGCFCPVGKPCHRDILLSLANETS